MIQNMDRLLNEERSELARLIVGYTNAKENKNYILSDTYRHYIKQWDSSLEILKDDEWWPPLESNRNRLFRMMARVERYKVVIYPFDRDKQGKIVDWEECLRQIWEEVW